PARGVDARYEASARSDATTQRAAAMLVRLDDRRRRRELASAVLLGMAAALPFAAIAWRVAPRLAGSVLGIVVLGSGAALAAFVAQRRKRDPLALAAHLDRRLPALGEGAALLIAAAPLPPLQRLQQRRTAVALLQHDERELVRLLPRRPLRRA